MTTKNNLKLDKEETEILTSIEKGEWKTVDSISEEIALAKQAAAKSLKKDARINIRLSSGDLDRIKRLAAYEGLPYQTLVASILHKYACGHANKSSSH